MFRASAKKAKLENLTSTLALEIDSSGDGGRNSNEGLEKGSICIEGNIGCGKSTMLKYFRRHFDNMGQTRIEILKEPINKWREVDGENLVELFYEDTKKYAFMFQSYAQLTIMTQHADKPMFMERSIYSTQYCFTESLWRSDMLTSLEYTILKEWFEQLTRSRIAPVPTNKPRASSPESPVKDSHLTYDSNNNKPKFDKKYDGGGGKRPAKTLPEAKRIKNDMPTFHNHILIPQSAKIELIIYLRCSPMKTFDRIKARARKEENFITFEYVKNIHDCYENWLMGQKFTIPAKLLILEADCKKEHLSLLYDRALSYIDGTRVMGWDRTIISIDHDTGTVISYE